MTASDTPEPWPNPLSDKLVAWRQRADMGSSFPPDIVLVLLDALTAARARIEQLEGALQNVRCMFADGDGDCMGYAPRHNAGSCEANGCMDCWACNAIDAALAQPPAVAPEAPRELPMMVEAQTCVPHARYRCAECTAALEAESGPPTRDETKPPPGWEFSDHGWPPGPTLVIHRPTGYRVHLADAWMVYDREHAEGTDSSEGQPAGHSAYDTKRCPACNDNGRACAWCGEDGPTGEGQPATDRAALIDKIMDRRAPAMEMLAASPGQPTPEPEDRSEPPGGYYIDQNDYAFWPELDFIDRDGPVVCKTWSEAVDLANAHRDRILAPERKRREAAERELAEEREEAGAFARESAAALQHTQNALAAAERERDAMRENAKVNEVNIASAHEELRKALSELAAAERRAEEAYDKGRAAAFREVLQEFDRRKWAEGGSGAAVREWVDRQRSIAEGKAEG